MFVNIAPSWTQAGQSAFGSSGGVATLPPPVEPVRAAEPLVGLRVRSATIGDMRQVEFLIRTFAARNLMLPRNFDQLARTFREFVVAVDADDRVVGCGALRVYNESLAEVCSLAIDERCQGTGIGRLVVDRLVEDGRELGLKRIFALTLTPDFFGKLGFGIVPRDDFPLKVWADCRNCPKLNACDEIAVAKAL